MQQNTDVIVIDKLSSGSVNNIDSNNIEFHQIDINNIEQVLDVLQGKSIDEVWHLAANSDIPAGVDDMNVDGDNDNRDDDSLDEEDDGVKVVVGSRTREKSVKRKSFSRGRVLAVSITLYNMHVSSHLSSFKYKFIFILTS